MTRVEFKEKYPELPYLQCGDGWISIIEEAWNSIKFVFPGIDVIQIKEKFGGLRFYYYPHSKEVNKEVDEIIKVAEEKCWKTCENCGSQENVKTDGKSWVRTLCNDCREKINAT